jgi:PAS domain S-box-containing protein
MERSFLMIEKKSYWSILLGILLLFGLYLTTLYSYLLFHSLAEIFSIVVACGIFMLAWNSRRFLDNTYLLLIGIAYLFIGGLDLLHTLAYKGMGVFQEYGTNLPTQLWIAARYLESLSLLIAPIFLRRKLKLNLVLLSYVLAFSLLLGSVFHWKVFPLCFVEGTGLTPFKKISEYIISLILLGSIAMLFKKRHEFDTSVLRLLIASVILTMVSELAFTFYVHAYGLSNLIGHYLKIISFYLIYKAIIETGLARPYALLFRNLKQSEEALRESEEKYRSMMEGMRDPVYICSPDYRVTYMNPAMIQRTGADLTGEPCYKVIHERDEKCPWCIHEKIQRGDHAETTVVSPKDGRSYHISHSPLFHTDGSISKMTIFTDITQQKRTEEALRRERDFTSAVLATAGALVIVLDSKGRIVRFNRTCEQLTGYSFEEVRGKHFRELSIIPEELESGKPVFAELRSSEFPMEHENYCVAKDGTLHLIMWSYTTLLDHEGSVEHVIGTGIDITERKKTENELRKLSRAVEQSPASVLITDADGTIEYVNPKFVELTGYTDAESIGQNPRILNSGKQPPGFYQELWKTITRGQVWRGEFHNRKKNGDFYWEFASISPIKNDEGVITHFVGVKEDITERKRAEEALQKAHDELERRVEERTAQLSEEIKERVHVEEALRESENHLRYLSSQLLTAQENERKRIALELHDSIGQTLSALKFSVENSLIQVGDNNVRVPVEPLKAIIPLIQESIEEVRRIQMDLRPSTLDDLGILATISWFCREFQTIYSRIRIEQQIDIHEDDVPDPLKIIVYRVLQEALNNITKHSEADLVLLSLSKADSTIKLRIEDNGLGFDLEDVLSAESSKRGLGLASMKERTELSGGSFSVESAKGKGTTIRTSWPRGKN